MRKIKNMLLLLFLLIVLPMDVYGALSEDNKHILSIESLDIINSKMTFKGYSFISHMDNWGKDELGDYGNMMTYFIVYTSEGAQYSNDFDACITGKQCHVEKTDIDLGEDGDSIYGDMFYSRCTMYGCKLKDDIIKHRKDKGFINSDSCNNGTFTGEYAGETYNVTDNECLYENVRFKVDIYIDTIIDTFVDEGFRFDYLNNDNSSNNLIYFKILTKNVQSGDYVVSPFNIHQSVCKVGENNCIEDTEHRTGYFSFLLPTFSKTAKIDAEYSIPFKDTTDWNRLDNIFFKTKTDFSVKDFVAKKQKAKMINTNEYCGSYYDSFVGLDSKVSGSLVIPGSDEVYYAPASHLTFEDSFSIDFKILKENLTCDSIKDGGIVLSSRKDTSDKDISCGESAKFYDCIETGRGGNSINATIYYLDDNPQVKSDHYYEIIGNDINENGVIDEVEKQYFLPVTVNADALIVQSAEFKFGNITPQIVRAGKGFSIENMYYENRILFIISGRYNNPADSYFYNTPYITYRACRPIYSLVDGIQSVSCDSQFSINEEVRSFYPERDSNKEPMKESSLFYYKNSSGILERGNSLEAAINAISDSFFSAYAINYDNNADNDRKIEDILKFKSCDSNSSDGDCRENNENIGGLWNLIDKGSAWKRVDKDKNLYQDDDAVSPYDNTKYRGFGKEYVSKYAYKLPHSYITLTNNENFNYGDIIYSNDIFTNEYLYYTGNKYYVGLKYSSDSFPFSLVDDVNPSLVDGMDWTLNGTCSVDVENGLFDNNGKPLYKYRSISLSNPFPKGNTSLNWRKWHLKSGNLSRLKNTYDYEPVNSFLLIKNYGSDGIEIAEINSCSSLNLCSDSYGTFDGLSVDGMSNFVRHYNPWANNKDSYCGLGMFSNKCDAFAGGTTIDEGFDLEMGDGEGNRPIISPITPNPGTGLETS